ncbi:Metallo-beta-lactamase superfamily protein [Noviherbaspirillum humi]|uniref:Metallo-beta-lactamase superfamily protein n=1 Tax=Noviherbaspirillum humi TaxID=1688639 RepID=A0A239FAE4_9BURK|nr:MBL fold metallo-hydrolase [Noviherbaspirillum humi]SNS53775.1 Metallo-beta-lactamase superfamily protein [Noviherbaspirillum humi]
MANVTSFEVGYCTHPACMALKGAGFGSRCFPSRAYLISTERSLHLWDTGYSFHFHDAAQGIYALYPTITPIHLGQDEPLIYQLRRIGVHPNDLSSIVLSHFHADHVAGLRDFPGVPVVCAAEGWNSVRALRGLSALRSGFLPGLIPADLTQRMTFVSQLPRKPLPSALQPFDEGWDLSGTEDVFLVPLPGHAIGHLGAFVREGDAWMLLASDAAWAHESIAELRGPSELSFLIQHSRSDYYSTLRKLNRLHEKKIRILLTHQASELAKK